MQAFARQADRTFTSINKSEQPKKNVDLMDAGFDKLQEIFKSEYVHSARSRFRWGSTASHEIPRVDPEGAAPISDHF